MGREMGCENPPQSRREKRGARAHGPFRVISRHFASFRVISRIFFAFYRVLRAFVLVCAILHPFCTVQRVVSRTLISREMRPGEAFPVENPFSPAAPAKTRPARDG
jgi:hypothetical protein